ncbi:hypothetical protein [Bradyrhizobium pachyrhizi]|uniref:hypothetical protein n=1 Tax=Bradyrhizobium pachyrhizi TaxID=280333 RepID=UPI003D36BF89
MIKPSIGRVVWYIPSTNDLNSFASSRMVQHDPAQPFKADVVFVWSDTCVNLEVVDHAGGRHVRTSVPINQEGFTPRAEWMPYQAGQAKKHDAAPAA